MKNVIVTSMNIKNAQDVEKYLKLTAEEIPEDDMVRENVESFEINFTEAKLTFADGHVETYKNDFNTCFIVDGKAVNFENGKANWSKWGK